MYIKKYLHLLEEFKVSQVREDLVLIRIVRGSEYNEEHIGELLDDLRRLLDDSVTIEVELVESIDTGGSIKRKAIESLVGRGGQPKPAAVDQEQQDNAGEKARVHVA